MSGLWISIWAHKNYLLTFMLGVVVVFTSTPNGLNGRKGKTSWVTPLLWEETFWTHLLEPFLRNGTRPSSPALNSSEAIFRIKGGVRTSIHLIIMGISCGKSTPRRPNSSWKWMTNATFVWETSWRLFYIDFGIVGLLEGTWLLYWHNQPYIERLGHGKKDLGECLIGTIIGIVSRNLVSTSGHRSLGYLNWKDWPHFQQ